MGLDSLMAVELRNRIKIDSVIDVPLVKIHGGFQRQQSGRRNEPAAGSIPFVRVCRFRPALTNF